MAIYDGILLVFMVFFALLFFSIHREEQRNSDRRKQNLPHPVERRHGDRRRSGLLATLTWAFRSIVPNRSK